MNYNRRKFLQNSGSIVAGMAIAPSLLKLIEADPKKSKPFGLQLYSLRADMPKDPKGVLKQVASYGYKQIEGYEGSTGMFWGMGHTDFKKYMDDLGMSFIASHCNIDTDFEKKVEQAAAIGMKYLICPSRGGRKTISDWKRVAEDFNAKGELCRKHGIRFAFHNHEAEFAEIEGQRPQDIMLMHTDANLVDFEMDIYWVVTAKQDPVEWLKKYPGRFKLGHVKDRITGATERDASCTLGTGSIDYPKLIKTTKAKGMEYYIVEQERYDGTTPLKAAEDDAKYMKNLSKKF
jgi:sugar phosphate isomerase/epimerase